MYSLEQDQRHCLRSVTGARIGLPRFWLGEFCGVAVFEAWHQTVASLA